MKANAANVPMRIGVNSGSLPKHLHELEREAPVEALVAAAVEFVELMESLDFENFKVSIKSTNVPEHDRRQPAAGGEDPLPAAPRDHRGGDEMVGLAEIGGRPRHPARRRGRRHDPDQPLDLPRRGGGQSRLGDPQGAAAARARPGPDRLPDLRPPPVRHGLGRRRNRAAAGRLRRAGRGGRPRLRRQRHRRGQPRRLRHRRRQERGPDLRPRQAAAEGARRRRWSTPSSKRSTSRWTAARSRSTRPSRARAPAWLAKIEEENDGELTPEKIAQMEKEAVERGRVGQGAARRGGLADRPAPARFTQAPETSGYPRPSSADRFRGVTRLSQTFPADPQGRPRRRGGHLPQADGAGRADPPARGRALDLSAGRVAGRSGRSRRSSARRWRRSAVRRC